jgi:II/X family phage/plasmid replication protein
MYAKLLEMRKHRPKGLSDDEFERLCEYAKSALRIEIRLHRLELAEKGLDFGYAWTPETAVRLYNEYVAAINIAGEVAMPENLAEQLPGALRSSYMLWRDGVDLRSRLKKPTFYRHRAGLLKFGVDIAVKVPRNASANIVPLRSVFEAVPLGVPEWARGTPLYFDLCKDKRSA